MPIETRNVERDSLFLMAELAVEGSASMVRAVVRNLSAGGMMVEGDLPVKRGQRVAVQLRKLAPFAGVVVWTRAPRYGIAFEEEIDPQLARAPVFGGEKEAPSYTRAAVDPRQHGHIGPVRPV